MILCLCEAVNERSIRRAVRDEGAATVGAIGKRTRAGTRCGSCVCDLKRVLADELEACRQADSMPLAAK